MIDTELNDALDAYSQRLKVLSEQATINKDEAVLDDLDLVIESLARNGQLDEAERLRRMRRRRTPSTPTLSPTFSAFEISNALLDILDDGHIVDGLRYGWKFDYYDEDRANEERLDFRDLVLARLQKGGGK